LLWQGYFHTIKDVSVSTTTIFAASENALFSKTTDNQIKTTILLMGFQARQSAPFTTVPF
jgi:hypothetical protein